MACAIYATGIPLIYLNGTDVNRFSLGSIRQYKGETGTSDSASAHDVLAIKNIREDAPACLDLDNFTELRIRRTPFRFTQCITYNGVSGNCSSSTFEISDFTATKYRGTSKSSYATSATSSVVA
ncbi:hypothetical protein BJX64DRAFT_295513 [Aspergillus heterothallicus]